jgi:hypothetical protein
MHKSLSPAANRILIAIYGVGVVALTLATSGVVFASVFAGAAIGAPAGILQRRALGADARAFAMTTTALDVRRVLTSSRAGKGSSLMTWLSASVLFVIAMLFGQVILGCVSFLAGFFAYMFVRDLITYSVLHLVAAEAASSANLPRPL